ncbi:hypothetical protein KW783_01175 [Candidatus Parcubacteria bacterium]|nr:hypothetical protein [Candidatus Parcubacteria bacterium]
MKNLKKGFIPLVLLIIAVAAIGGGSYYYKKSKNKASDQNKRAVANNVAVSVDTVNLKTYTNQKLGFEFKYPTVWKLKEKIDNSNKEQILNVYASNTEFRDGQYYWALDPAQALFMLTIVPMDDVKGIYNSRKNFEKNFNLGGIVATKRKTYELTDGGPGSGVQTGVEISAYKNNYLYIISLGPPAGFTETFDKILSTFKFTKPVTTSAGKSDITTSVLGNTLSVRKGEKVVQTIALSQDAISALGVVTGNVDKFITNQDVNFDGHNDVGIFSGIGYGGVNIFYDYYLFNPKTEQFEKNSILMGLSNTQVDAQNKTITSTYKSGPGYDSQTYKFDGSGYIKLPVVPAVR